MAANAIGRCGCLVKFGRPGIGGQVHQIVGSMTISRRHESTSTKLTSFKRGRGGRSSFSGIVATVFGSTGFLGRYVVNKLGRMGSQVIVPYRGEPLDYMYLKLAGELGQIQFMPYTAQNEEDIRKAMKYSNVVINLIGRDFETRNFTFDDVHIDSVRQIARIAKESGVEKFLHFSSLNASEHPQQIYMKGGSRFLKTKFAGELAVKEEFPEAIIFRPSDIFGPEDRFIRYYASVYRRAHSKLPLWHKGDSTIKQPVFVSDVAEGVIQAIKNPDAVGKTFEVVGPNRFYLSDLAEFFYQAMRWRSFKRIHLTPFFRLKVHLMSLVAPDPMYNSEKLEREHITDILTGCPTLEDLGVALTKIEDRAPYELKPYRRNAYYSDRLGEFPDPIPPPIVT